MRMSILTTQEMYMTGFDYILVKCVSVDDVETGQEFLLCCEDILLLHTFFYICCNEQCSKYVKKKIYKHTSLVKDI